MALPKSVVKFRKDGVEFVSNVDRTQYTLTELSRAALRDTAKFIRRIMIRNLKELRGMRRHRRIYNSAQYWVRRRETDLVMGFKHDSWYGAQQELGDRNQPRRSILRNAVYENLDDIRRIQGQYLSAIEDDNKALGLIDADGNPYYSQGEPEDGN